MHHFVFCSEEFWEENVGRTLMSSYETQAPPRVFPPLPPNEDQSGEAAEEGSSASSSNVWSKIDDYIICSLA